MNFIKKAKSKAEEAKKLVDQSKAYTKSVDSARKKLSKLGMGGGEGDNAAPPPEDVPAASDETPEVEDDAKDQQDDQEEEDKENKKSGSGFLNKASKGLKGLGGGKNKPGEIHSSLLKPGDIDKDGHEVVDKMSADMEDVIEDDYYVAKEVDEYGDEEFHIKKRERPGYTKYNSDGTVGEFIYPGSGSSGKLTDDNQAAIKKLIGRHDSTPRYNEWYDLVVNKEYFTLYVPDYECIKKTEKTPVFKLHDKEYQISIEPYETERLAMYLECLTPTAKWDKKDVDLNTGYALYWPSHAAGDQPDKVYTNWSSSRLDVTGRSKPWDILSLNDCLIDWEATPYSKREKDMYMTMVFFVDRCPPLNDPVDDDDF